MALACGRVKKKSPFHLPDPECSTPHAVNIIEHRPLFHFKSHRCKTPLSRFCRLFCRLTAKPSRTTAHVNRHPSDIAAQQAISGAPSSYSGCFQEQTKTNSTSQHPYWDYTRVRSGTGSIHHSRGTKSKQKHRNFRHGAGSLPLQITTPFFWRIPLTSRTREQLS